MYLYDRAAWLTTDDLLVRLPQDRRAEVGGWVVSPAADGLHIDYFGKNGAADRVIYAVDLIGGTLKNATVYSETAEPPLKGPALSMAAALRTAWAEVNKHSEWRPCT